MPCACWSPNWCRFVPNPPSLSLEAPLWRYKSVVKNSLKISHILHTPSPAISDAVKRIAHAKGWPETWLNDNAKMYDSHFHTDTDWKLLIEDRGVVVCIAGPKLLLAMKLLVGRGRRDETDIERLLDALAITSLEGAVAVFDHYYPTEVIRANALRQLESRFSD